MSDALNLEAKRSENSVKEGLSAREGHSQPRIAQTLNNFQLEIGSFNED